MTQEQFIQIFPAYVGCKIRYSNGRIDVMNEEDLYDDFLHRRDSDSDASHFGNTHPNEYKLILRSFDQITDEEYIQFIKVIRPEYNHHPSAYFYLQFRETGKLYFSSQEVIEITKQLNYLRSIGIDCDGLIEAGYAIKGEAK